MKLIFKALSTLLIVAAFVPSIANAACSGSACSGEITRSYINTAGTLYVRLAETNIPAETSCTFAANYASLPGTNPSFREYYAMILTAQALGSKVIVRVINSSSTCEIGYITLETPVSS